MAVAAPQTPAVAAMQAARVASTCACSQPACHACQMHVSTSCTQCARVARRAGSQRTAGAPAARHEVWVAAYKKVAPLAASSPRWQQLHCRCCRLRRLSAAAPLAGPPALPSRRDAPPARGLPLAFRPRQTPTLHGNKHVTRAEIPSCHWHCTPRQGSKAASRTSSNALRGAPPARHFDATRLLKLAQRGPRLCPSRLHAISANLHVLPPRRHRRRQLGAAALQRARSRSAAYRLPLHGAAACRNGFAR